MTTPAVGPTRPRLSWVEPVIWALFFSSLGTLLLVLLGYLALMAGWRFLLAFSATPESEPGFWTLVRDHWEDLGRYDDAIFAAVAVVSALSAGVLLLLRRGRRLRTWPATLQGLTATVLAYVSASSLAAVAGFLAALLLA